jgi:hypothetical protein
MSVVTLDSVFFAFQQWRSQRKSRAEPIPVFVNKVGAYAAHRAYNKFQLIENIVL